MTDTSFSSTALSLLDFAENGDILNAKLLVYAYTPSVDKSKFNIVNMKCPETGMTALMCASQGSQLAMVRYLLQIDGIEVNATDKEGDSAIVYACKVGCYDIVDLLVSRENVNKRDSYGMTLLMCAIKDNYYDIVSLLLTHGADVSLVSQNERRYNKWTLLMFASYFERSSMIKLLYSNGVKIEILDILKMPSEIQVDVKGFISNEMYITPLHECVYNNDLKGIKHLVKVEKLDINQMFGRIDNKKSSSLWKATPLFLACYLNRLDMVKLLLQMRADVHIKCGGNTDHPRFGHKFQQVTALMMACSRGYTSIVKALLEADIYHVVDAAREGCSQKLECLLNSNKTGFVESCAPDTNMNALLSASLNGHSEIVSLLIRDYRANPTAKTTRGFTPLMLASVKGHDKVVEILFHSVTFKRDLLINEVDKMYGYNALQWASFKNHKKVMTILVNNGADVLSLCRFKRAMNIVLDTLARGCIKNGVNESNEKSNCEDTVIDLTCWKHSTPLHQAVYDNDVKKIHDIITFKLAECKDNRVEMSKVLDAIDDTHGWTALILACYFNRINIVKVLVLYGADISKRIKHHECSAVYIASSRGHFEIVDLLCRKIGVGN